MELSRKHAGVSLTRTIHYHTELANFLKYECDLMKKNLQNLNADSFSWQNSYFDIVFLVDKDC